jgi:transglutaminase-like putative cysteine protease
MRLNAFIYKVIHGGTSRDALPFPVTVSAIFWYIGVLSAWSVFRRGAVWAAVIPAGVGLLVNAYYYLGPARLDLYLAVYVLLALLFVARMNLVAREREWQTARVSYSPDLRLDFLRAGLAAALAGVIIAWAAPSLAASPQAATSWRQMSGSLSVVRESWMRMFAAIRGYGQAYNDFYSDSLTLSGPARLTNTPIMDVHVNAVSNEVDQVPGLVQAPILRYYWRAAAYSNYADGRWSLGDVTYKEFNPTQLHLNSATYKGRRQVSLAFTMHLPASSRLYIAPQMLWVDRISNLELTYDSLGTVQDVAGVRAQQVLRRGETYQIVSSISVADSTSLRAAGQGYPPWVAETFLQLPPEITSRTRDLAQQIVREAGAANPYDRTVAVTQWLRDHITYDQNIEAPPPNVEPIDYVLFTSRRGYCNYYASAEVILLRSLGIPARLAGGFNQGKLDAGTGIYHVLEENAHAWPEVYFPNYGWIEFEPTASEDPLVRPEAAATTTTDTGPDEPPLNDLENGRTTHEENMNRGETTSAPPPVQTPLIVLWLQRVPWTSVLFTLGALVLAVVAVTVLSLRAGLIGLESLGRPGRWVMARQGRALPSAIALVYMQLERVANWLGLTSNQATTPFERSAALSMALPAAQPGFETITNEYVAEQYSQRPADSGIAERAWRAIRLTVWHDAIRSFLLEVLEE